MRSRFLTIFLALTLIVLACSTTTTVRAEDLTCQYCTSKGYSYLCRVPMSEASTCLSNSGEVQCNGNACTCCRKTNAKGCSVCDASDDDDDEEDSDM